MRSQRQQKNDEGRDHRYNPPRFSISEARDALGLSHDVSDQKISQSLKELIENTASLPAAMQLAGAHNAVSRAFIPCKPDLFGPAAELEAQNRDKLRDVIDSIRELRSGLERFRAFPRYCSEEMPGSPAGSLVGHSMPQLPADAQSASSLQRRAIDLPSALSFLSEHFVIGPSARQDIPPSPELTGRLRAHGLDWRWNGESGSWDPRKMGSRQSLFRAAPLYFDDVHEQIVNGEASHLSAHARALLKVCAELSAEIPRPLAPGVVMPQGIVNAQRLALYSFFVATEPRR